MRPEELDELALFVVNRITPLCYTAGPKTRAALLATAEHPEPKEMK